MESDDSVNIKDDNISKSTELLSQGLLALYEAPLKDIQKDLIELNAKQYAIYQRIHEQNLKLSEAAFNPELSEMFVKAKLYKEKAENIRKKMSNLYARSSKLKKRVLKLELQKQKESLIRAQQREREEQLIGQ